MFLQSHFKPLPRGAFPQHDESLRLQQAVGILAGNHRRRLHAERWSNLPDGAFVVLDDATPALVYALHLVPWTDEGYGNAQPRPRRGTATTITPPSTLAALRAGYPAQIADGARDGARN